MKKELNKTLNNEDLDAVSGAKSDSDVWSSALIDCVGGNSDSLYEQPIEQSKIDHLVQKSISPFWSGNVYRYRF